MSKTPLFNSVADLIPHRSPMILLDKIIDWGDEYLEAEVEHSKPGIFTAEDGSVPAWVGIEYMAQAISAWGGIQAKQAGEPIKIGFLLGTRRYISNSNVFAPGEKICVRVEKMMQDENNLALFNCQIRASEQPQDNLLASAQIKAIQPDNVDTLLQENRAL